MGKGIDPAELLNRIFATDMKRMDPMPIKDRSFQAWHEIFESVI